MSYDLHLYLKTAPSLTENSFADACSRFGLTGELAPDFTADCSDASLSAKIGGLLPDGRSYLAVVDCSLQVIEADQIFALPAPRRKLFEKKADAPTLTAPAGSYLLTFACGMDLVILILLQMRKEGL